MKYYIKKYQWGGPSTFLTQNSFKNISQLTNDVKNGLLWPIKLIAERYATTPSGFSGNVVQSTKQILNGEVSPYTNGPAKPSIETYLYGTSKFPKSSTKPRIDVNVPQYDVNFGLDTLYIPKQDSILIERNLNKSFSKSQFGHGPFYTDLKGIDQNKPNFYDAGKHTIIPRKKDGKHYMEYSDIYNFDNAEQYLKKYGSKSESDSVKSNVLAPLAVKAMELIGVPYEVHQTVPIKYINGDVFGSANSYREYLQKLAQFHKVKFRSDISKLSDEELESIYSVENEQNLTGDEIVKIWKGKGLVSFKQGGSIHIKEKNKGKFTESAKRAGKSVQEYARDVVNNPKATKLQKKRAQFALNAKKFKHD